jgi:hypothetical protein
MKHTVRFAIAMLLLAATPALAYVVKFKDGTQVFARTAYTVKGTKAIITLENGTVTQYDLDKIDQAATEAYNEKYKGGNVTELDTPTEKTLPTPQTTAAPVSKLGDLIRQKKAQIREAPTPSNPLTAAENGAGGSWGTVDRPIQDAFIKFFDGAGITQYRLSIYRGKLRLLSTANSEEAVFNALAAAARAVADLADKGKDSALEIVLTTSGGENAGTFAMSPEQARALVNGQLAVADYFVKNVAL